MKELRVGVLRGGPSTEYEVSLMSGKTILDNLSESAYSVQDIFIDKNGVWHMRGKAIDPSDAVHHMDVAVLGLHGEYGEDGGVQRLLDDFGIPYTGSDAYASTMAMHKGYTKDRLKHLDILMPRHRLISVNVDVRDQILAAMRDLGFPLVVKPARGGSSVGVSIVHDETGLVESVRKAFETATQVMVEEMIQGREATCGVIENFRGEDVYALLPVEIVPHHESPFFDYEAKYSGKSQEICPAKFSPEVTKELERLSRLVHKEMELSHYSRSDFMVTPKGIYFLEVNTLPGLTEESLLPKSIKAVGSSMQEFLDHIIGLARR